MSRPTTRQRTDRSARTFNSGQRNGDSRSFWLLRALALVIAVAGWLVFSFLPRLTKISEPQIATEITASIGYETDDEFILLNAANHAVKVRVRGPAERVRTLTTDEVDIQVPFPRDFVPNEPTEVVLSLDQVSLPEDLIAESLNPESLTLLIDRKERVQKPVRPIFVGEPAARATVNYQLTKVIPAQVFIEGPLAQLEKLSEIVTRPINLAGHGVPFTEQGVGLAPPSEAIRVLQPTLVTVQVVLEAPGLTDVVPGTGGR